MTRRNRVTRLEALEAKARQVRADREEAAGLALRAGLSSPVPSILYIRSQYAIIIPFSHLRNIGCTPHCMALSCSR